MSNDKREAKPERQRLRPRRTKAARDLEHLVPGGRDMTDDQLEIALDLITRSGW